MRRDEILWMRMFVRFDESGLVPASRSRVLIALLLESVLCQVKIEMEMNWVKIDSIQIGN